MKKRRIALGAFILGSAVLASFFGGGAVTLLYISLFIPLFSFIYTVYVYMRFRVYQVAENKIVVKGEKTPYFFVLSNEDIISFSNVSITFSNEFSTPQDMNLCKECCLLPKEKIEKHTEILCRYRGEYNIGVKSVTVTDFLGIMKIRYPAPSTINMTVLPKITHIDKLALAPVDTDAKLLRFSRGNAEPPDCEVRKYIQGDSIKLINWKLSAKKNELYVRQQSDIQNGKPVFIMDMSPVEADDYARIITEDKIIESALTVSDYLVRKNVPLSIVYEQDGVQINSISSPERLKAFYVKCAGLSFSGKRSPSRLYAAVPELSTIGSFVIFAVSRVESELCAVCDKIINSGTDCVVLYINENKTDFSSVLNRKVIFRQIRLNDEAADILGGNNEN